MDCYMETDYPEEFTDPWVVRLVSPALFPSEVARHAKLFKSNHVVGYVAATRRGICRRSK